MFQGIISHFILFRIWLFVFVAIYGNDAIALHVVANWLVHFPGEDFRTVERVNRYNQNTHHTCALVDEKLENEQDWDRLLFQIRHQDGSVTRSMSGWNDDLVDKVLSLRSNRLDID